MTVQKRRRVEPAERVEAVKPIYHCTECGFISTVRSQYRNVHDRDGRPRRVCLECHEELIRPACSWPTHNADKEAQK